MDDIWHVTWILMNATHGLIFVPPTTLYVILAPLYEYNYDVCDADIYQKWSFMIRHMDYIYMWGIWKQHILLRK